MGLQAQIVVFRFNPLSGLPALKRAKQSKEFQNAPLSPGSICAYC